jgi:predicted GNAT family acetyltransferase
MFQSSLSGVFQIAAGLAIVAVIAFMNNDDFNKLVAPAKKAAELPNCNQIQQDYTSRVSIPCVR